MQLLLQFKYFRAAGRLGSELSRVELQLSCSKLGGSSGNCRIPLKLTVSPNKLAGREGRTTALLLREQSKYFNASGSEGICETRVELHNKDCKQRGKGGRETRGFTLQSSDIRGSGSGGSAANLAAQQTKRRRRGGKGGREMRGFQLQLSSNNPAGREGRLSSLFELHSNSVVSGGRGGKEARYMCDCLTLILATWG